MKGVFLIGKKKLKRYYDQIDAFFTGSIDAILNNNETAILSCMREHPLQTYPRWGDKRIDATWQHRPGSTLAQVIIWTNVEFTSNVLFGIQQRAISADMLMHLIRTMYSAIAFLKSLPYHPGDNGLTSCTNTGYSVLAALIFDWKYIYFCQKNAFHKVVNEIVLWTFQPRLKSSRKNNFFANGKLRAKA